MPPYEFGYPAGIVALMILLRSVTKAGQQLTTTDASCAAQVGVRQLRNGPGTFGPLLSFWFQAEWR
jgi:hypothetical protein